MTTTPKGAAETKSEPVVEAANKEQTGKVVPSQVSSNTVEVIDAEPTLKERVVDRAKSLITNKRVVASVTSVVVIASGVFVARRRNAADEENGENTEG